METPDPSKLPPKERGERAIQLAESGSFNRGRPEDAIQLLREGLVLLATGRISFGGPAGTWRFVKTYVAATVKAYGAETRFFGQMQTYGPKAGRVQRPLEQPFGFPPGTFRNISYADTDRLAAIVLERLAPRLAEVVPEEFRPSEEIVPFSPEDLRRIVREELREAQPPRVEIHPERPATEPGVALSTRERLMAEEAEGEEVVTRENEEAIIREAPAAPIPENPIFPTVGNVEGMSKPELAAFFKVLNALKNQGKFAPAPVLEAARKRWRQKYGFDPPSDLEPPTRASAPIEAPRLPSPPPPSPPAQADLTRHYVEERIHAGPEGIHRELVRGAEAEPTRLPSVPITEEGTIASGTIEAAASGIRAPMPLAEKYRPRFLEDIVGNRRYIQQLEQMIRTNQFPTCIILYGEPGIGKSSTAQAFLRTYLRFQGKRRNDLSFSDTALRIRDFFPFFGTEDVKNEPSLFTRERIIPTLRSMSVASPSGTGALHRFVVLDDVLQELSVEAQRSLLTPLERTKGTVIFTANDISKVIPPLRSRCVEGAFEFRKPVLEDAEARLRNIIEQEHMAFPDPAKVAHEAALAGQGDLRAAVGELARAYRAFLSESGAS